MGYMAAGPGEPPSVQDRVDRWWPLAIAISGTMVLPFLGIPFAIVMAVLRRRDRLVTVSLIAVAVVGALLLTLFGGAGGDGFGTGGTGG